LKNDEIVWTRGWDSPCSSVPEFPGCPCKRSRKGTVQKWPGEIKSIKWVLVLTREVSLFSFLNACSVCWLVHPLNARLKINGFYWSEYAKTDILINYLHF